MQVDHSMRWHGVRWGIGTVALIALFSTGFILQIGIDYWTFRLSGGEVKLGSYRVALGPGWLPVRLNSGDSANEVIVSELSEFRLARVDNKLILRVDERPFFGTKPVNVPMKKFPWGSVYLISPNDTLTGISPVAKERGVAVFDDVLVIEYSSLRSLEALSGVTVRSGGDVTP